jgi:thioredoxin-related protein
MKQFARFTGFILILFCGLSNVNAQSFFVDANKIDSLQKTAPKPVIVFIHTNWCKYCQLMSRSTFSKPEVLQVISEKYYMVSINAEEKQDICFAGKKFGYVPNGNNTGINQLAIELGTINGELSYPSLCFLNSKYEIIYQRNGYVASADLLKIINTLAMKY